MMRITHYHPSLESAGIRIFWRIGSDTAQCSCQRHKSLERELKVFTVDSINPALPIIRNIP